MLDALAEMYATHMVERDTPYLLYFVESYAKLFPAEKDEVADVLLDLSHGVFVDAKARGIWRDYYLAALRLDLKKVKSGEVEKVREGWRQMVRTTPEVLYSRLGPQIRCAVPSVKVGLVAFGEEVRLSFDVNTAQRGVLRMIPGIEEAEVSRWLETRETKPFQSVDDFKKRAAPGAATLGKLVF